MTYICELRLRNPANAEYEVVETQRMTRLPEQGSVVETMGGTHARVAARYDSPKGSNGVVVLFLDPLTKAPA
jgi:hypothetical protein